MYIAMNRFKVKIGSEEETLFASHTEWESEADFTQWINSEAFAKAHAGAGAKSKDIYLGPPKFEGFNSID